MTKEQQLEYDRRRYEEALPAYHALMSCYPFTLENLDGEEWRIIDEHYQISNFGRVKSFWRYPKGKILKPQLIGEYLLVTLRIDGKRKHCRVHILVARAFVPNPENKPEVNHDDGRKFNCHVSNLVWATSSENVQHAFDTGLKINSRGMDSSLAKIKDEETIRYIRDNPDNLTQRQLAEKCGVKQSAIGLIQRGETYANAGGTIRKSKARRISEELKVKIRADYATGNYSINALAQKYGCAWETIRRIINEVTFSSTAAN